LLCAINIFEKKTIGKTKTAMARGCHGRFKNKNWKETAKDRRTGRDLAEKAKAHKGL